MFNNNIGIVLVRLFSIYLAISSLQTFFFFSPISFPAMTDISGWISSIQFWLSAIAVLLPAVCALFIWRYAEFFVPEYTGTEKPPVSAAQLMLVGISLLGLYFFVWGVISLARVESSLAASEHFKSSTKWAQRAPYLTQILVAAPMLLGRKRLASLLLKAKYVGAGRS